MGAITISLKISSRKMLIHIAIVLILFLSSSVQGSIYSINQTAAEDKIISKLSDQIEIPAGSDYHIKFNSQTKNLEKQEKNPMTTGLSEQELQAVAKAPTWIQRKLIQQFQQLNNTDDYVQLLLKSDLQYTDEIAFTIACSPLGKVPPVEVVEQNVHILYQIDPFIQYADIIDYDEGNGNYYSTIRYWVLDNDTILELEYPMDIYYWYVVHPRVNREEPMLVYERTWREYYFYHNDVGHPLMKENVQDVAYLWDSETSTEYTGVHAVSYWIGNTIRYEIIGDRPGQPSEIVHEHTGYCGEAQKVRVAALRTGLIPINGVMNYAEDHVWGEFYERGWYHYDGAINRPYMYTDGWGKDMSSIWGWNGDSSIYEVTSTYLHPEDRATVEFNITDGFGNPVDGAVVTVFVKGLKDVTWYKDYFSDILDLIWDKIPDILKIRILERLFDTIYQKIDDVDEVIDTYQVSIWNHTDTNGRCKMELGTNDEYIFIIQKPDLRSIWPAYRFTRLKTLTETQDISYNIRFNDFTNPIQKLKEHNEIQGEFKGHITLDLSGYQLQRNIITTDIGTYDFEGELDFFIVDEQNFERYQNGRTFDYYYYHKTSDAEIDFQLDNQDYYIIFRNPTHMTNVILDYDLYIETSEDIENIAIVTPTTEIFETPIFTIGTVIDITGITTNEQLTLTIGDEEGTTLIPQKNLWHYQWDTRLIEPGTYPISAEAEGRKDTISIQLIDTVPPSVEFISPNHMDIFENEIITISGTTDDNYNLQKVELFINENTPVLLDGKEEWSYNLDMTQLTPGEHQIQVKAYDQSGLTTQKEITLIRKDSEHEWYPIINSLFITPENPTNTSNIRIYSNITSDSPFSIKQVIVCYDNGDEVIKKDMFRYGDYPPQERHIEDNIQDIPNDPIYGIELGRFQTDENITYWVEAIDTADNKIVSESKSFIIA